MLYVPDPQVVDVVALLVTVIAPIVVGLITKASTSSAVKAWLLAAIAALVGFGQNIIDNPDGFDLWVAVLATIEVFVVGVALHFGLWKATGVSAKAQASLRSD